MQWLVCLQFSALAFYILCSIFVQNFVIQFVVTVLLIALDFWTVKNVSGRILVGLRWWNEVSDQGESVWHYESLDQQVIYSLITFVNSMFSLDTFKTNTHGIRCHFLKEGLMPLISVVCTRTRLCGACLVPTREVCQDSRHEDRWRNCVTGRQGFCCCGHYWSENSKEPEVTSSYFKSFGNAFQVSLYL
jgi:hypothetical protein